MPLNTLRDLLVDQLQRLYAAERHQSSMLPRLVRASTDLKLESMFRAHADQCSVHLSRLERVFEDVGMPQPPADVAETNGMRGLIRDCLELANMAAAEPHVRDAALIALSQHIEHDQIAGYGCARTWAQLLGHYSAASELQKSLNEERRADSDLTRLAEGLNRAAVKAVLA